MSGGFFRGTSAEQDTRFSNKQAKLMKSQKFAPELENLVDMTKVKMDVLRPWIANRVTEFIGFEDEVLINFIYGLLEGKVVNGKEIQISLTGFMERNTGKFMKELWVLLLSAQNNASGVPQQFLDAKEEESKKKKAETDRLANEIQRRKDQENRELEQERHKRMDAGNGVSKDSVEPSTKDLQTDLVPKTDLVPRTDLVPKTDTQKQYEGKNGFQGRRSSRSPLSADRSSPRGRRLKPASRSISNSKSNSKSRSRSVSISPKWRRRPNPSENRVPPRVSQSPYRHSPRRSLTPARRRSSYYRRRSISQSPPRYRMRSPVRRRSRSPLRRRSRSPMRRRSRSPVGPRSRSPIGRRSPIDRSLSPVRARSPITRRRSPAAVYRRSPMRYNRSPSPWRRRNRGSPMLKRRSPSPLLRSTSVSRNRRSPSPVTRKSSLPRDLSSSSHSRSASPVRRSPPRKYRSPVDSSRERTRDQLKSSKVHDISLPSRSERASGSLKRDTSLEKNDSIEPKSTRGFRESPMLTNKGRITQSRIDSPQKEPQVEKSIKKSNAAINDNSRNDGSSSQKSSKNPSKVHKSPQGVSSFDDESSKKMSGHYHSDKTRSQQKLELNNKDEAFGSGNKVEKVDRLKIPGHQDPRMVKDAAVTRGIGNSSYTDGSGTFKKTKSRSDDNEIKDRPTETLSKSVTVREVKQKEKTVSLGSSSEESNQKRRNVAEKEKNKRPRELESENESSFDSYEEERKEAKRRKKEEKKSRKEERRRKRHERRRKREERHAMKKTLKSVDSVSSASDSEDDAGHVKRRHEDTKETEFDQKKLEMQLREKALESLRAKKGIGH